MSTNPGGRRRRILPALLLLALGLPAGLALAANPNEREVKPQANVQDLDEIYGPDGKFKPDSKLWVLNFRFKDPRLITVDIPKRGRKVCWYLWYQVSNHTSEPHDFIPDFELVTDKGTVHHDQILPTVQEAVRKLEDPTDYYKIKNSVTIHNEPIPPSKSDADPRWVTGVAVWDDVNPDLTRFSIFVGGLSNGWSETDPIPPAKEPVLRRKTLQLNFRRPGDRFFQSSQEIRFVAPAQWIYRASGATTEPKGEAAPKGNAAPPLNPLLTPAKNTPPR
jgi:hypothetical protein